MWVMVWEITIDYEGPITFRSLSKSADGDNESDTSLLKVLALLNGPRLGRLSVKPVPMMYSPVKSPSLTLPVRAPEYCRPLSVKSKQVASGKSVL